MKPLTRTAKAVVAPVLAVLVLIGSCIPTVQLRAGQSPKNSTDEGDCKPVGNRVCKLAVQITTRKGRGAGTDNAVYFDIGPLSWRLNNPRHNDFESGNTDTFELTLPPKIEITTDDILWLRLQKKGLFGFNGTRDGLDGAWHPEQVVLIVNGVRWPAVKIEEPLNSRCWFWRNPSAMDPPNPYLNATNFARTLRLEAHEELTSGAKLSAFVFTPFKKLGISGWLKLPESRECVGGKRKTVLPAVPHNICVTGTVEASAKSTDGLATIDLEVRKIEFCTPNGRCDDYALTKNDGSDRPRYLRVEYKFKGNAVPKQGEQVRICGKLRWDTDKEGWWEIHPRDCNDVTFLQPSPLRCRRAK